MPKERTLRTVIPGGQAGLTSETLSLNGPMGNWESYTSGGYTIIMYRTYFDLRGYAREDMTTFPQTVLLQSMGPSTGYNLTDGLPIQHGSFVTTDPINPSDITYDTATTRLNWPGMSTSLFDLNQIMIGRVQALQNLTDTGQISITSSDGWGAGQATAGNKLYITEVWAFVTTQDCLITIPDLAVVMPSIIDHEESMVHLYRQYQSFETQQQT
tara:strand:+ start:189 stop:827 length:639 start_codon:yes stop_codon:yes gene_type:complete